MSNRYAGPTRSAAPQSTPTALDVIASVLTDFGVRASLRPATWGAIMVEIEKVLHCAETLAGHDPDGRRSERAREILREMIKRDALDHR